MATWTRSGTGTAPSSSGANLTGTYQLDNATAPADFDPDAVSSVRFQWTITGSGFSDDTWTDVGVRLTDGTNTPATAAGTGGSGLGNATQNNDVTDSTVSTGLTAAQWEGLDLQGNTNWATYSAVKMSDGASLAASAVTVTITYTPDTSLDITPAAETVNVTPGGLTVTTGSVDITPAAETVTVTPGTLTVSDYSLPWTDDWTGTNGDAFSSTAWQTLGEDTDAATVQDIQSNEGRTAVGPVNDEYTSGVAQVQTDILDSEITGTVDITAAPSHNAWLYLCFRSSGEIQSGSAGRPATAYYFRIDVNSSANNGRFFVRNSNTETQLVGDTGLSHTANTKFKFRAQLYDNGSDIEYRLRTWDFTGSEGGSWDITGSHKTTDPGTQITTAGPFQYVHRNVNSGASATSELRFDDWTLDEFTSADNITPAAVTVTATPGGLTVTAGQVDITPAAETVTVTPGTLTVTDVQSVTPAAVTVTATPGGLTVTAGQVDITPAAETVTVTPGTVSLAATYDITPSAVTVTATPGTLDVTASADITPTAETVTVTPGGLTVTAGQADITPDATTVTATPGTLTVVLGQSVEPAAVTVTATPGGLTVTTGQVDITPSAVTVTATPGTVEVTTGGATQNITPSGPTVTATPGTLTVTASADVTPAAVTVTATPGTLTVAPAASAVTPDSVTVTATPGSLTVAPAAWAVTPDSVTVTATPGGLTVTKGAANIVPVPATVTVTPGTVSLVRLRDDITPASVAVTVTAGTLVIQAQTYTFVAPTFSDNMGRYHVRRDGHKHLLRHYSNAVAQTVYIKGGVAYPQQGVRKMLLDSEISTADSGSGNDGKAVFTNGQTYNEITNSEKTILEAAGYTVT